MTGSLESRCLNLLCIPPGSWAHFQAWWVIFFFNLFFIVISFFYYSMNFITFIGVQPSSQPNFIAFPSQTLSASLQPPTGG